jgi:general L-amino acid transport system permease protein
MSTLPTELPGPEPDVAGPPPARLPPGEWMRVNLFSTRFNSLLTVIFGVLAVWIAYRAARYVFVTAEWEIVRRNLTSFMIGRFPRAELWRPIASMFGIAAGIGLASGLAGAVAAETATQTGRPAADTSNLSRVRRFWPLILLVGVLLVFAGTWGPLVLALGVLATGVAANRLGGAVPRPARRWAWLAVLVLLLASFVVVTGFRRFGLDGVAVDRWGGLQLTLFVTIAGIVLAFPLGILLALGRRSSLPAVRAFSVGYIEFFRGVPLITLLLMGQFILGFFLPPGMAVPSLIVRALVAIVLFEAAYIAEIVRGGLQAVPRGQFEAAQAVGLSPWKVTRLIVMPQALRAVIPAMVGQFISLYQDTSLLAIVGFLELLDVGRSVTAQPGFAGRGLQSVTLPFVAFVYWAVSYTMSRDSQRLERRLGIGVR